MMINQKTVNCACDLVCKAIEKYIAKEDSDLVKALKKAGYIDAKYTIEQAKGLEDELADILNDNTDKFIKLLDENSKGSIQDVIDKFSKWNSNTSISANLETVFYNHFSTAIPQIAQSYIKSIDKELAIETVTNRTTSWIKSWSGQLADIMQVNTEDKLERVLSNALKNGNSVVDTADKLLESSALQNASRARTTALTEMLRANSVSAQESYIQSPAVEAKRWRHTGGYKNNPRDNHIDMDKQTVSKEEPFELIGADGHTYYPMYPRDIILPPGESVNCHCIHQPIVNEDILGMSLEEREKLQSKSITADNKKFKKEQKKSAKLLDNNNKSGKINTRHKIGVSENEKSKKFNLSDYEIVNDKDSVNDVLKYISDKMDIKEINGTDLLTDGKTSQTILAEVKSLSDKYGVNFNRINFSDFGEEITVAVTHGKGLSLNTRFMNSPEATKAILQKWTDDYYIPKGCNNFEYIGKHEYYHLLTQDLIEKPHSQIVTAINRAKVTPVSDNSKIDIYEYVSDLLSSDTATKKGQKLRNTILKMIRKGE